MSWRRMPEVKFQGLVIKIFWIKVAEVSVILVGLLINGIISKWENVASSNDHDRLLNRSTLNSPQMVTSRDCSVVRKLIKE